MSPPLGNATCNVDLDQEFPYDSTSIRMERIALEAESRINQMMAEEKRTGTHFPHLNRDIQALASLKKSILKQREWELQHGDLIRTEHEINMEKNIKKRFNKLLDYLGDDGQKRLICMTNQFLEMAEKIAVPGEINAAEGKLVLVDDNN
jgi:hypothetical protein